jgi:hypothetical protein
MHNLIYFLLSTIVKIEDEHDVTWFFLEKGKKTECLVCNQVFQVTRNSTFIHSKYYV